MRGRASAIASDFAPIRVLVSRKWESTSSVPIAARDAEKRASSSSRPRVTSRRQREPL